jgi:hypothetical protein
MQGRMHGYAKPKTTSSSLNWHVTTAREVLSILKALDQ